jgi:hypothetical protein
MPSSYGFSNQHAATYLMSRLLPSRTGPRHFRRLLAAGALILVSVVSANGDIPATLQRAPAAGCYCPCHDAATRRGCTKMCDARKNAVRWLAVSCMKPRFQPPHDKAGAGPHLRHPDRAEHAELIKPN